MALLSHVEVVRGGAQFSVTFWMCSWANDEAAPCTGRVALHEIEGMPPPVKRRHVMDEVWIKF